MENHSYSQIIGSSSAPYENSLATQCGLATNYVVTTHPSLPNYIAATSGDVWGITDDNPPASHPLSVPSIYSQVKAAGLTWRDYEESAPGNCPASSSGTYAVKHDPAPYYTGIRSDCVNWDVPLGTTSAGNLVNDINAGTLPSYSFITPNLCNDMHDCSVSTGDTWLSQIVPRILAGPNYRSGDTAVIITFDEGSGANPVMTLVLSPSTPAGVRSATAFNHYSLLKTTEEMLGIGTFLAHAGDAGTTSMRAAFGL
jgi:phospholipase C